MTTMKAVCLETFGGPEALQMKEVEVPRPADNEVLIQVHAASVNPADCKIRAGRFAAVKPEQLPKILGRDISGTIVAKGSAVRNFNEGDDVYAMLDGGTGGYAEYVTLRADLCVPKPASLSHVEAAAVPLAAMTAWQGLFDYGHLHAAQRVLIHGGAGGVGHFSIQFAKAHDAQVSTTVAAEDREFVRSLGADQVIDYKAERFEDVVQDFDLIFDLVGGDTQERSWSVLKDGGTLVSTVTQPSERQARQHDARAVTYVAKADAAELSTIRGLIDAGNVRPHVQATFPLQQAAAAQTKLENEHTQGKIVLDVHA